MCSSLYICGNLYLVTHGPGSRIMMELLFYITQAAASKNFPKEKVRSQNKQAKWIGIYIVNQLGFKNYFLSHS